MRLLQSPAVRVGLSISIATGLYGVSFGALSVTSGLDFWQTMALSLLLFSGGSQFAFIGVVAGGGSGVAAMGAATLLGMRNGIYGMQINALLQPRGWLRFAAAHVTIDESTATSTGQTDPLEQKRGFWTAGLGIFVLWNLFTAVGALAGGGAGGSQAVGPGRRRRRGVPGPALAAAQGPGTCGDRRRLRPGHRAGRAVRARRGADPGGRGGGGGHRLVQPRPQRRRPGTGRGPLRRTPAPRRPAGEAA